MNARTQFQTDWIDGPALELAMLPVEERCEKITQMGIEIEEWVEREFPDLSHEKVIAASRSYTFEILHRVLEIAKASSGAVGHG